MSGGSYGYLCFADDLHELLDKRHELQPMAERLTGLGYAEDAAAETEEIDCMIRQLERRISVRLERLKPVWKAVEWWDSSDSGEDVVKAALKKYRDR